MEYKSLVSTVNYGYIEVKLDKLIQERAITKTRLAKLANTNYKNIKRLCDGQVQKLDLDIIARICCVLECELSDIVVYRRERS